MRVHISIRDIDFISFESICRSGIAWSYGSTTFNFLRNFILFSIIVVSIYISTNSIPGLPFSTSLPTLVISCLFDNTHPNTCEVISCGFDLLVPWWWVMLSTFSCTSGQLYVFFEKCPLSPLPILKLGYLGFFYWVVRVPYLFWILTP